VDQAVQQFIALALTRVFASVDNLARSSFLVLGTKARNGNADVTRRATSWMTKDLAPSVSTVIILLFVTILPAGVREHQGRILWFVKSSTETLVLGKVVLSVAIVAVGACPAIEC